MYLTDGLDERAESKSAVSQRAETEKVHKQNHVQWEGNHLRCGRSGKPRHKVPTMEQRTDIEKGPHGSKNGKTRHLRQRITESYFQ